MVDCRGYHLATCPGIHGRHHDSVRDILFRFAQQAQFSPQREPSGVLAELYQSKERPADILIPNYSNGKPLCLDVTIVSSFTDITKAASTSGYNAARAAQVKRDKYEAHLEDLGYMFRPFAMESIGGFDEQCDSFLLRLGKRLSTCTSYSPGEAVRMIKEKISFDWQRSLGTALEGHAQYLSAFFAQT